MEARDFYQTRIKKAKGFGFPEPIFINVEKLTQRTRVIYLIEVQATHVGDQKHGGTHHFYLKFSKFKKIKEEPFWTEEDLTEGFTINNRNSIDKLFGYIKANQALLGIDILSKDFTSAFLSNDDTTMSILRKILSSGKNKEAIFELFKDNYPEVDKKILVYKLIQERRKALQEFESSLKDPAKNERSYWQPFLEKNRWVFGLSFVIPLSETRIDLWNIADYLFQSTDGFIDIVEIKHPFIEFWQKDPARRYTRYRGFIQPSERVKSSITQATNYIFQLEKKFADPDWQKKNGCDAPVKPTCAVVIGRSGDWGLEERTAFRLLNDSLHGIEIITFDHLYDRASRLLKLLEESGS